MRSNIAPIINLVEYEEKLKPLTNRRPVASLPFGGRYRLIDFPFSSLYNAEARSAALFISGSGHSLYDHIRAGAPWGLETSTGGGVFTHSHMRLKSELKEDKKHPEYYYNDHYSFVTKSKGDYVVMMGSSLLSNVTLDSVVLYHQEKESSATIVYKKIKRKELLDDTFNTSLSFNSEDSSVVKSLNELSASDDKEDSIYLNMGVMVIDKKTFLDYLFEAREKELNVDVNSFLHYNLDINEKIYGYEYTGYLKAIEDINSYYQANMDMLDEDKFNALFYRAEPVRTRTKDSAPTYYGDKAVVKNSQIANDCEVYGTVKHSMVFRKVTIAQDAHVESSIVMQDSHVEEGAYLKHVILDKHVYVKSGAKLVGTPDKPIVIEKNGVVLAEGETEKG